MMMRCCYDCDDDFAEFGGFQIVRAAVWVWVDNSAVNKWFTATACLESFHSTVVPFTRTISICDRGYSTPLWLDCLCLNLLSA